MAHDHVGGAFVPELAALALPRIVGSATAQGSTVILAPAAPPAP